MSLTSLSKEAREPLQVVVVDDVCRFALYVWRYLSRCIGFGAGDIPKGGRGIDGPFWNQSGPCPLETPAREARIWWVNTNGRIGTRGWIEQLEAVLDDMKAAGNRRFLVDVRGPYHSTGSRPGGTEPEDPLEILMELLSRRGVVPLQEVMLVSSYHTVPRTFKETQGKPMRIHPKSADTLERLWARLPSVGRTRADPAPPPGAVHILVTGAGFELRDPSQDVLQLGMRWTSHLLERALTGMFEEGGRKKQIVRPGRGFCWPGRYAARRDQSALSQQSRRLRKAARDGNLDSYWDELLTLELLGVTANSAGRPDKEAASQREYDLRESFRRQLVADDWGFLGQALAALDIPGLAAWLTTNYTRFADRAIDLKLTHEPSAGLRWRIISTASEAERRMQELLHTPGRRKGKARREENTRFLFKLHGDLAHLLTMAIAGHDKEIYSPLSLPVSSLHGVYTAAELSLKRQLETEERPLFWHVVGHGLKDELLVRLIRGVCEAGHPPKHRFVVVGPDPAGPVEILRRNLAGLWTGGLQVLPLSLRADQYLPMLAWVGVQEELWEVDSWMEDLRGLVDCRQPAS